MKTLLSSVALLALTSAPALAEFPFEGEWAYDCEIAAGDLVPTVIADGRVLYYESECSIDNVAAIGAGDQAWNLKLSCAGEGDEWQRNVLFAVELGNEGEPLQLIEVDLDDGYVLARDRCDLN
ncbi:hypothetical protein [Bauldia litoralis]|uniref:Uncharacterized protein n=1 Tax=Bauldia litoralis TaxID=665467 RepID=A0A1G6DFQ5_9HYPH|nr:hypothetical protein [Bauldia litoralis]SDB43939.1 hypothetical protein SAMN02982931_03326 [Bauldia litoralis]